MNKTEIELRAIINSGHSTGYEKQEAIKKLKEIRERDDDGRG